MNSWLSPQLTEMESEGFLEDSDLSAAVTASLRIDGHSFHTKERRGNIRRD